MITQMNAMSSSEVWQDIQGYSGIYQVGTSGRIRSLKKGKIELLKPYINNIGYAVLSLYANHKQKTCHVHKLVAGTFLVKVDGKNYIDHINGIETDNRIDNLRWCTPKENANFGLSIINRKRAMRKACGVPVNQYDLSGNYIATYATLTDAQTITGIAYQNIRACCIGRYKTAGNYIWKFNK